MLGKLAFLTFCVMICCWFAIFVAIPLHHLVQRGFVRVGDQVESVAR